MRHLTPCDKRVDIDPHVTCMETFTTVWYVWRHFTPCDMHGDIDRHVACMKTLTTMWYAWRHLTPCDMHGDIDYHVTCMETLTAMWHAWRNCPSFLKVYVMKVCKLEVLEVCFTAHTCFESLCCEKCVSWKFASRHTHTATRKRQISEGRAMRRKRRAETRLVNWITVTIVTYHYDYNIVPPQ